MGREEGGELMETETHRSPYTYELVDPNATKIDRRKDSENVQARVRGHVAGTNCESEQLYANNDLRNDPVATAAELDPDRLFRQVESNPPNFAIIHEKPWHRMVIYLKAQGLSDKELAVRTGKSAPWISQLCRQPWFRLRLVQEMKDAGVNGIQKVLQASALDSVFTLIDIRDDANSPKAVRRACADSLLDRYLGRAVQRTETTESKLPTTPEIQAIDTELGNIEEQLKNGQN